MDSLARWVRHEYGRNGAISISYADKIREITNITSASDLREVTYFQCTQYGFHRTTPENTFANVYPDVIDEEYFDKFCTDAFGNV